MQFVKESLLNVTCAMEKLKKNVIRMLFNNGKNFKSFVLVI